MNITRLNTYGDSINRAFEALCNQLFDRWVHLEYPHQITYFTTVNGAGGDGGVEAYAVLKNGNAVGVQAKWFPTSLDTNQINQIRKSIATARNVRSQIKHYIVCLPRDFQSKKIGRGQVVIGESEEDRINALIDEMALSYPDLTLEFWNEERIRQELQRAGNEGITRFWFDREELAQGTLQARFSLAKSGWLHQRYTPNIHQLGKVHLLFDRLNYSVLFRRRLIQKIHEVQVRLESTKRRIEAFWTVVDSGNRFYDELNSLHSYLAEQLQIWTQCVQLIQKGSDKLTIPTLLEYPYESLIDRLYEAEVDNVALNAKPQLITALEEIHHQSIIERLNDLDQLVKPHNAILFGLPGTGKTHGVAREIETRITEGYPALLIQAKAVNPTSWAQILREATGGLNEWSETEILLGLEALAFRKDQHRVMAPSPPTDVENEPTHVLICVDGIDESPDIENWRHRISEARQLLNDYPRLRFIFTCRSYPPYKKNPCDLTMDWVNRPIHLPVEGDYPVGQLAKLYLNEYGINYASAPWILNTFENALSLKLFCEKYRGLNLADLSTTVTTSTVFLIRSKFDQLENEFINRFKPHWSTEDQVFTKTLQVIAELFGQDKAIEHDSFCTNLVSQLNGLLRRDLASQLVNILVDHGVLWKQGLLDTNPLAPVTVQYRLTYQSYFDYFLAVKAVLEIRQLGSKEVPAHVLPTYDDANILRTTAIILLNDYGILVGEEDYWVNSLDADFLFQIKYQALTTGPDTTLQAYIPLINRDLFISDDKRNFLLKTIILPNLQRPGVNLALDCIHASLTQFSSTYERDLAWSGPSKYNNGDHKNIGGVLADYHLEETSPYDELPLILGWSLATVNNHHREKARVELTNWAAHNINELIQLLNLLFFCGDPQIQEDLASILLGLASRLDQSNSGVANLAQWVSDNVFDTNQIVHLNNAIVRLGARSVINRAYALGECSDLDYQASIPPYTVSNALLPLDFSGRSDPQGGRFPIVHDLAWYVIQKAYHGFLDYTTHQTGKEFLNTYQQYYKQTFGPNEWAISVAIAFIKSLGWRDQGQTGMTEASHGSMSQLATLEEKYTWLAVHEIKGYLADRLSYKDDHSQSYPRLPDYNLMIDIPNPAYRRSVESQILRNEWYVPENLSPAVSRQTGSLQATIHNWVNRKDVPDFDHWIHLTGLPFINQQSVLTDWVSLYMYTHLLDPSQMGQTTLEMVCGLIDERQLQSLIDLLAVRPNETKKSYLHSVFTHLESSFFAHPEGDIYTSVVSNVWMNQLNEIEPTIDIQSDHFPPILIHKTVAKATERAVDGEKHYKFPAKFLRQDMGITGGNQTQFLGKNRELLAFSHKKQNELYEHQEFVAIHGERLAEVLTHNRIKPFWVAFQHQSTSTEFKKAHKNIYAQNCRLWLIWKQDQQVQNLLFHDDYYLND